MTLCCVAYRTLTVKGVRRILETDLGLPTKSLDAHKEFVTRLVDQVTSSWRTFSVGTARGGSYRVIYAFLSAAIMITSTGFSCIWLSSFFLYMFPAVYLRVSC